MPPSPAPPTLIFLPGLANDAEVWDDVRAHLRHGAPPALQPLLEAAQVSDVHCRHATLAEMAQALLAAHAGLVRGSNCCRAADTC